MATLYSDDVVSANNGGELGFMSRGELLPEFERAAFKLKDNEISEVVETKFGFHLIQMIERRGEQINARHILIKPKFSSSSIKIASDEISLIKLEIDSGLISFDDAVVKYSEDNSKNNGGLIIWPKTHNEEALETVDTGLSKHDNQDPNATIRKTIVPEQYNKESPIIKKGSVLLIHSWLVHASNTNNSDNNRYALLCTYLKEHTDFRSGSYAQRVPFTLDDTVSVSYTHLRAHET